ncbi:hypothetical protein SDC9_159623 [bioreactor metagenome]|uniref:Uncharacterized protein n=1 Tax=bioreactor metagenome TaxID=1076179 RepID=A0A645FDB6_9ZZZZ
MSGGHSRLSVFQQVIQSGVFDKVAYLYDLVDVGDGDGTYLHPFSLSGNEPGFLRQPLYRLPHRRAAHAKALGQFALFKYGAGRIFQGNYPCFDLFIYLRR